MSCNWWWWVVCSSTLRCDTHTHAHTTQLPPQLDEFGQQSTDTAAPSPNLSSTMCVSPDNWVTANESTITFIFTTLSTESVLHQLSRIFQGTVMCEHWSDGWVLFYTTYVFLCRTLKRHSEYHSELPLAGDWVQKINTSRYAKPVCYLSQMQNTESGEQQQQQIGESFGTEYEWKWELFLWMRGWRGLSQDSTRHLIKHRNATEWQTGGENEWWEWQRGKGQVNTSTEWTSAAITPKKWD